MFSSYLGGQEWDEATGVATDVDGNTYVTGFTLSTDFPRVGDGTRGHAAIVDAFVTKVVADGGRIAWSTQLGGVDLDMANAVTLDDAGNVYVVGRTGSPDFPTRGGLQAGSTATPAPASRATTPSWSSSPPPDACCGPPSSAAPSTRRRPVAVDGAGAVYVAGLTDSPDLPVR